MKKILKVVIATLIFSALIAGTVFAAGGKVHGELGQGCVNQEDPVGPGDQPDWQD